MTWILDDRFRHCPHKRLLDGISSLLILYLLFNPAASSTDKAVGIEIEFMGI